MSDSSSTSPNAFGVPTLPGDTPTLPADAPIAPADAPTVPSPIPPPPAAAPLVQPSLPALPSALPAQPAAAPTTPVPAPTLPSETPPADPGPQPVDLAVTPSLIPEPVLPPVGTPAVAPPAESTDAENPLEKFGLPPANATDAPREIPEWKRRQNSRGRKLARRLALLAVLGGLGAGGYFVYQTQLASDGSEDGADEPSSEVEQTVGVPPIADADAAIDAINENALDVDLIEPGDAPVVDGTLLDQASYRFRWSSVGDVPFVVQVDGLTKNYEIASAETTVRRVGDDVWVTTDPANGWSVADGTSAGSQTFLGLEAFITSSTALPDFVTPFALTDAVDAAGIRVVTIDDAALAAAAPEQRTNWLAAWSLDPAAVNTTAGITITISERADGVTEAITIATGDNGGATTYQLEQILDGQVPIEVPTLSPGAPPVNDVTGS